MWVVKCPNCSHELKPEKINSTVYWHCHECGALWFDNKENDFLTLEEAQKLDDGKDVSLSRLKYSCPRDEKPLKYDSYYYRCFSCGGVLTSPSAVVQEKTERATRFKPNLKRPLTLSQLKYVAIFASVAIFIGVNVVLFNNLKEQISIETQAKEIASQIRVRSVGKDKTAIYFSTSAPYKSGARFQNTLGKWSQPISTEPTINHFLIINTPSQLTKLTVKLTSVKNEEELSQAIEIRP